MWLDRAIALHPDDADAKVMLAEAFWRRDDFQKAAAALNGVDVSSNQLLITQYPALNVAKLESFKGETPYEVQGEGQVTRVKFLKTDPLPLVSVRVNGGEEVTFFIDTGGSEVALDTDFAKELGLPQFGDVQGTFSGGQNATVQQTRIDSLALGDWTVKNLPAITMPCANSPRASASSASTAFSAPRSSIISWRPSIIRKASSCCAGKTREAWSSSRQSRNRRKRRGSVLDGERSLHGGLGARGDAAADAALR